MSLLAGLAALIAACWAGVLALAEETPAGSRALGQEPAESEEVSLFRAVHVSRISMLFISGLLAAAATQWWSRPVVEAIGVGFFAAGFVLMIAEALPRAVGVLAPDVASATTVVAKRGVLPFGPIVALVERVEGLLARSLVSSRDADEQDEAIERDLLLGVFSLGETTVEEIMTPRLDIVAVNATTEWSEVVEQVRRSEHSRLPVFDDTLDSISGVLYAKDLVAPVSAAERPERWQDLIRTVPIVPETKSLADQLRDFQRGPAHIAIVVDEFGGTSGVVTLEDVLEEVVGEIHDEYDVDEEPAVEREGDDKFWVDGSVTVDELSALLGMTIPDDEVATVGGLVYAELGHVPEPGEEFHFGRYRVVVERVVQRRIRRVYFERQEHVEPGTWVGVT